MAKNKILTLAFFAAMAVAASFLSGCASQPLTMNYSPSSTLSAEGSVKVASFAYSAADGSKIKKNQIRNTALGNAYFEKDIATIYQEAVFKELRFVGIKVDSTKLDLGGDVLEFLMDDLGYSVDWTLRVKYQLKDRESGKVVYETVKEIKKKTEKFGNIFGVINEVIKLNIEELIKDEKFRATVKGT